MPLDGATLPPVTHIFLDKGDARGVLLVHFALQGPRHYAQHTVDVLPPYDLMGTRLNGTAQGLDTTRLRPGTYTLTATMYSLLRRPVTVTATFTVG